MKTQKIRNIYAISLILLDGIMVVLAFSLAYEIRVLIPWPAEVQNLAPFRQYIGLISTTFASILTAQIWSRQYYIPRAASRVDQFYAVSGSASIGILTALGIASFLFKGSLWEVDYPRIMIFYVWLLTIIFLFTGRMFHQWIREQLRDRGIGKDRLLIVGSSNVARMISQRVTWTPKLGYELVGVVNDTGRGRSVMGSPILGRPENLPNLIQQHEIDEVIIALPEKGHREVMDIVSLCGRGRVSVKIFPDIFQVVTTQANIDDLGGLPLLTVRDYAMRGYLLIIKRLMDFVGALVGLIFLSPLMLLVALAIKLESPGPAFFVQVRMGLDGRPFPMIKFRSMRSDAEKQGPGWTVKNDPRQTRLGAFLRRIDIDELPNLMNVLLGEMSLVGPRPEQPHYVEEFRKTIPRYMERHREKAGMTGWAQLNGLRGDTPVEERTEFDIWYSENWSVWLDIKILLRTVWRMITGRIKR